jgi:hypothetical protein
LTPASDGDLPPLAELLASEPLWLPGGHGGPGRRRAPSGLGHYGRSCGAPGRRHRDGPRSLGHRAGRPDPAGLDGWCGPSLVLPEDLGRGTVRGTGHLIVPAWPVPPVRFPVLSVQPARAEAGTVSLVMRRSSVWIPIGGSISRNKFRTLTYRGTSRDALLRGTDGEARTDMRRAAARPGAHMPWPSRQSCPTERPAPALNLSHPGLRMACVEDVASQNVTGPRPGHVAQRTCLARARHR